MPPVPSLSAPIGAVPLAEGDLLLSEPGQLVWIFSAREWVKIDYGFVRTFSGKEYVLHLRPSLKPSWILRRSVAKARNLQQRI